MINSLLNYCFDDIRSGCSGSCGRAQALQSNASELSSDIKKWKETKVSQNLNNWMINNEHYVTFAGSDETCTQTWIFSSTPLNGGEIILLFIGKKNVFLSFYAFDIFRYVIIIFSMVIDSA